MISSCRSSALPLALALWTASLAPAGEALLQNADFADWSGGRPVAWTVSQGAKNGDGGPSTLDRADGGGLALAGGASTGRWLYVAQPLDVRPGACLRLRSEARVTGARLDPGQYGSCYVGIAFSDAAGQVVERRLLDVRSESWTPDSLLIAVPEATARAEAAVFLAQTGRLEVRRLQVERLDPADSYDALVDDLDRHYPFFELKGIDWAALAGRHAGPARAAADVDAFADIVAALLGELRDHHVWIERPGRPIEATHRTEPASNFDYRVVASGLVGVRQIGRTGFFGRTADGLGYLALGRLQGPDADFRSIEAAVADLRDGPGILLDIRANTGGQEVRGQRIASLLADRRRVYARSRWRAGPAHDSFVEGTPRQIAPAEGESYSKPIVVLVGPTCMSSGEALALMLAALPHATLVGLPTRGSSGNPAPIPLPNGLVVHASRWISLTPDGTPIEDRGVEPDRRVEHEGPGDPTYEAGLELLRELVRER